MNRRLFLICFVALGAMVCAQNLLTPRSAGADEPAHLIRAAGLVRGDVFGSKTDTDVAHRSFDVPSWVGQPDPACFVVSSAQSAGCATVVETGDTDPVSTAGSYPVWGHILPGLATLAPGGARTYWLARALHGLIPVLLLATVLSRLIADRRSLHAAAVLLALTPSVLFNMAVINPSGVAIAGAIAMWVAGDRLFGADADDHPDSWLFIAGSAALLLPRNDGVLWWVLILAILLGLHRRSPRSAIGEFSRVQVVMLAISVALSVGWTVAVGSDLVAAQTDLSGWSFFEAVVGRTGDNLREAIGVVGWLDTPIPESMMSVWWLLLGVLAGIVLWLGERRRVALAAVSMITFIVVPWVLETIQGRTAGLFWQGRYAIPVFVGAPLLLGGVQHSKAQVDRALTVAVPSGAIIVWNVSLWQQSRRWGVGVDGSMLPWRWDTWSAPLPVVPLLVIFLVSSMVLFSTVRAEAGLDRTR